jgi:hypothetical protein
MPVGQSRRRWRINRAHLTQRPTYQSLLGAAVAALAARYGAADADGATTAASSAAANSAGSAALGAGRDAAALEEGAHPRSRATRRSDCVER